MLNFDHIFLVTNDLNHDRRMHRICRAFVDKGCSVILIGRELPDSQPLREMNFDQKRIRCFFHKGPLFYLEFQFRMISILAFWRFYNLTCVDLDTILIGRILRIFKSFKFYFDAHELFTEVPELSGRHIKKNIWSIVARFSISKTDARYTVGNHLSILMSSKYKKPFCVIRNVPDYKLTERVDIRPISPFIMVYLGVLNVGRGLLEIIRAMGHLPNYELHIIGDGDISLELSKYCHDHEVQRVTFHGLMVEESFSDILLNAHIGLNLLDGTSKSYYFSLANKFFDYIQHNLPVLTMNFPEYQSLNKEKECAVLLDDLNIESIIKGVRQISDPVKYHVLKANCTDAKTKWNWSEEKEKLYGIYK